MTNPSKPKTPPKRPVQGHTARVAGHALRNEGQRSWTDSGRRREWQAMCSCGEREYVTSATQGKRWHRQHKADVVVALGGAS